MNKNIEKEFKVLLTKEQFDNLYKLYPGLQATRQVNTYYDTQDRQIQKAKGAMRIREKEDSFIFTLKMMDDHTDGLLEYECPVTGNDVTIFEQEDIKRLLHEYHIEGNIEVLTELTTYRSVYKTEFAELCFDISHYHNQTDYEIEYEYKKDHDGLSVFQALLDHIHVKYEHNCLSKIQRAIQATNIR